MQVTYDGPSFENNIFSRIYQKGAYLRSDRSFQSGVLSLNAQTMHHSRWDEFSEAKK